MKKLNRLLEGICGLVLIAMTFFAIVQVITRYVLEISYPWLEEAIRYLMIFTVFVGSAVAIYQKSHLNVDLFDHILKSSKARYLEAFRLFAVVLFSIIFGVFSSQFLVQLIQSGQVTPALQISMGWPMSALLIGSVLMILNGAFVLYSLFASKEMNKEGGTP